MDLPALSSNSVLEMLLKTNRPPTDQERAIIQQSMSPTNAKLKAVEAQISEAIAHIQALKSQIEETENKLQRLREQEAAILETSADHRRVLSTVRDLPEDVIREIFIACVDSEGYMPRLSYYGTPLPYVLAQISSKMRHIALTTPYLWASMNVCFGLLSRQLDRRIYSILARKATEWFRRAGTLSLAVFIEDPSPMHPLRSEDVQSDPSSIFFDTLLSYSNRWRRFQFRSMRRDVPSAPIIRIAALTAVDVPLLESISLDLHSGAYTFCNGTLLTAPTLKHLTLDIYWDDFPNPTVVTDFTVNWATLTSVTLGGAMFGQYGHLCSIDEVAQVLQRTRCLVFCDISVCPGSERTLAEINLPFLEILRVEEEFGPPSSRAPSILDSINAPILSILKIRMTYLDTSLADFFKRSPDIQELTLFHLSSEESLAVVAELLHHCPSLSILSLQPWDSEWTVKKLPDANSFLRAFVHDNGVGITCPRLQKFSFEGAIKFSLQTLHQFLDTKQHGVAPLAALLPWKSVEIDMRWVDDSEIHQMLDLVSQKQTAGLDIHVHVKDDLPLG